MSDIAEEPVAALVPLTALFADSFKISVYGVGGGSGLFWARRIAVERRRWMGEEEFAEIVSLCQFMPGPNGVGIVTCIGAKLRGAAGAVAAIAGFLLIPWIVGFAVGFAYLQHAHQPVLRNILGGVAAVAAGSLIATGLKMLLPHRRRAFAMLFAALACGLLAFAKLPLLWVLFGLTPLSIAAAWWQQAKTP